MEMTLADKLFEGLAMSLMGFIIVFTVLLVIMGILSIFNLVAKHGEAKTTEETPETAPAQPVQQTQENLVDDTQLVAVITAAIMAMQAENGTETEGTDGLVVKSIRRVNAWNTEALQNNGF